MKPLRETLSFGLYWTTVLIQLSSFNSLLQNSFAQPDGSDLSSFRQNGKYTAFYYPPPGKCFPSADNVYIAISTADGIFKDSDVLKFGIQLNILINGNQATSVTWSPSDNLEADEGLSHHISLPGLPDGAYHVGLELFLRAPANPPIGLPSETTFTVDARTACAEHGDDEDLDIDDGQDSISEMSGGECPSHAGAECRPGRHAYSAPHGGGGGGGGDNDGMVLLNVARGRRSWVSHGGAGAGRAGRANDGSTLVPAAAPGGGGAWRARHAVAAAGEGGDAWWEVDLGEEVEVHTVDIWEARRRHVLRRACACSGPACGVPRNQF